MTTIMTKWTILDPDGSSSEGHGLLAAEPSYDDLKQILDPLFNNQWWERVSIRHPVYNRTDMFVDELGLLKQLPLNGAASLLYPYPIVGRAVVFHRRVWF